MADDRLAGGPHTIEFLATELDSDEKIRDVWEVPATIAIRTGSCCFDIGLASTTPCVSDLTFAECDTLNTGPLPPVFRDGEPCPDDGDPCALALGACFATIMTEDNEREEYAESSSRNGEEVDRDDVLQMVVQERSPCR